MLPLLDSIVRRHKVLLSDASFSIMFPFNCKTQDVADRARDHPFLVGMLDGS